jgi:PAS domain S-box-containing protein
MSVSVVNPRGSETPARSTDSCASTDQARFLLAAIVASSDDAIISKTLTGIITSWNRGAEAIFGYTAEEAIGRHISLIAPPGGADDMTRIIERIVLGERVDHYETRRCAKSGEILTVSITVSPIRDDSGEIIGASKIARNITPQKKAQEVLRKNEKLAVIGRMAASIAHEINNPLEAVTNLLYLLKDHTLDAEGAQYLEEAQREVSRIATIAARTLSFHRNAVQPVRVQAARILDETLDFNRPRLVLGRIEVSRRYRAGPTILCFEGELRQVFMNLVGNAADAMPGGGRLSVRVRPATDPKTGAAMVRITLADTGVGMDRVTLERLFEPFYTTKGSAGTGLGLWISDEIIRKHKGHTQVRSCQAPARTGTVFVVHLPVEPTLER